MTAYIKKIKLRIAGLCVLACASVGINIYGVFFASAQLQDNFAFAFLRGILMSAGVCAAILLIRNTSLLKNEKKLRQTYNRENDERMVAIRAKAGLPMMLIASMILIAAGIGICFVNVTVGVTLFLVGIAQMTVSSVIKLIYMRRL